MGGSSQNAEEPLSVLRVASDTRVLKVSGHGYGWFGLWLWLRLGLKKGVRWFSESPQSTWTSKEEEMEKRLNQNENGCLPEAFTKPAAQIHQKRFRGRRGFGEMFPRAVLLSLAQN